MLGQCSLKKSSAFELIHYCFFSSLDLTRRNLLDSREDWVFVFNRSSKKHMGTHLHAGSPTSLKKTHVPPFKQNAFPITGHADPEWVQLCGVDGKWPSRETTKTQPINHSLMRTSNRSLDWRVLANIRAPGTCQDMVGCKSCACEINKWNQLTCVLWAFW